ncbi:MAG TPA: winged helix-turn-helix transcriptional regulator [Anaerolineales bacterium]|nr:winged helix-turn-helix transcriptional regulator [Anaerolineales bacterium]HLE72882.1 winged helix-turn-helix transcriptional regulator [Anaerolineales bacterium]
MDPSIDTARDMLLLEQIEIDPDVTQASLASQLGIAVGTVNWHLKRLVAKGYVKVKRAQRRKLRYIITTQGISRRARLTVNYVEHSMQLYRKTRRRVGQLLDEAKAAGAQGVHIDKSNGDPEDIVDICKLTCLEQGMTLLEEQQPGPTLRVVGHKVQLEWEAIHER